MALGISCAIIAPMQIGCKCGETLTAGKAQIEPVTVAVLTEENIVLWESSSRKSELIRIRPEMERMTCTHRQVIIGNGRYVGMANIPYSEMIWAEVPEGGKDICEGKARELIRLYADERGKSICIELVDGPPSTATCSYSQRYNFAENRWSDVEVCPEDPTAIQVEQTLIGPKGKFQLKLGESIGGDYEYVASVKLRELGRTREVELLSEPRRQDQLDLKWENDEQFVLFAGKIVSLPDMSVQVEGKTACVLP